MDAATRKQRRLYRRERIIYAMACPCCGVWRYVGHTARTVEQRYKAHRSKPLNEDLKRWFAELDAMGKKPVFIELTKVKGYMPACETENRWIALASIVYGRSLLNRIHRGDYFGLTDFKWHARVFYREARKEQRRRERQMAKLQTA